MIPFSSDYNFMPVRSAAILTTSYVAGTVIGGKGADPNFQYFVGPAGLKNQLILYVDFTLGSLTTAELIVEFSNDNSDWYQETEDDLAASTGINTERNQVRTFVATGKYRIPITINDNFIRVSVKGTGTTTGSSMKIGAVIGNN